MSDTHRQYELVYVVSPEVPEDGVNELHDRITGIIEQLGGKVDKTDNWGRRRLAYEIGRHREGTYVIVSITGPGELVTELDRRLRVMEQLLRHLVIRMDEEMRKAMHKRDRRQRRQDKRRARKAASGGGTGDQPADAPADTPVETPGQTPVAAPAESPAEAPVESLAEAPVESQGGTPAESGEQQP